MIRSIVSSIVVILASVTTALADDDWRKTGIVQTYLQTYDGSTDRQLTFNAGAYLNFDYLDSGGLGLGYNYTFTDFDYNADLSEHMFYLTGRYNLYTDFLPGKVTLRMDAYAGEDTLRYNINNPPTHTGGGMGKKTITAGGSSTVSESADVMAYQPQLSFINFSKSLYLDLGYAYSEYSGETTAEVDQFTPTVGIGWNDSYEWLQLRGYLISLNEPLTAGGDDQYNSLEIKYTHWFADSASHMEYWRLTVLTGTRVLAVDPDAAVIYSMSDTQKGALSASVNWKLTDNTKVMTLVNFTQYENESSGDDYNSLLIYLNLQKQW